MKSYTDLEQSKKLGEILSKESADLSYDWFVIGKEYSSIPLCRKYIDDELPCWSLAALLNVINTNYYTTLYHDGVAWNIDIIHHDNDKDKHNVYANTPIDACVEMILKLNE